MGQKASQETSHVAAESELPEGSQTVANELPGSSESDVFGVPSQGATRWRIKKKRGEDWIQCETALGDATITEWPLADLSLKGIRARWGAGTYRITWIDPKLKKKSCGTGRVFALRPLAPPPAPAPAAPAPASGMPLGALLGQTAAASPQSLAGVMALMGGESSSLAQALVLLQVLQGMSLATAEAQMTRERMAYERERERDRNYYRELTAANARAASSSQKQDDAAEEVLERLDALDEAVNKSMGQQAGGGGLLAAITQLAPLLQGFALPKAS